MYQAKQLNSEDHTKIASYLQTSCAITLIFAGYLTDASILSFFGLLFVLSTLPSLSLNSLPFVHNLQIPCPKYLHRHPPSSAFSLIKSGIFIFCIFGILSNAFAGFNSIQQPSSHHNLSDINIINPVSHTATQSHHIPTPAEPHPVILSGPPSSWPLPQPLDNITTPSLIKFCRNPSITLIDNSYLIIYKNENFIDPGTSLNGCPTNSCLPIQHRDRVIDGEVGLYIIKYWYRCNTVDAGERLSEVLTRSLDIRSIPNAEIVEFGEDSFLVEFKSPPVIRLPTSGDDDSTTSLDLRADTFMITHGKVTGIAKLSETKFQVSYSPGKTSSKVEQIFSVSIAAGKCFDSVPPFEECTIENGRDIILYQPIPWSVQIISITILTTTTTRTLDAPTPTEIGDFEQEVGNGRLLTVDLKVSFDKRVGWIGGDSKLARQHLGVGDFIVQLVRKPLNDETVDSRYKFKKAQIDEVEGSSWWSILTISTTKTEPEPQDIKLFKVKHVENHVSPSISGDSILEQDEYLIKAVIELEEEISLDEYFVAVLLNNGVDDDDSGIDTSITTKLKKEKVVALEGFVGVEDKEFEFPIVKGSCYSSGPDEFCSIVFNPTLCPPDSSFNRNGECPSISSEDAILNDEESHIDDASDEPDLAVHINEDFHDNAAFGMSEVDIHNEEEFHIEEESQESNESEEPEPLISREDLDLIKQKLSDEKTHLYGYVGQSISLIPNIPNHNDDVDWEITRKFYHPPNPITITNDEGIISIVSEDPAIYELTNTLLLNNGQVYHSTTTFVNIRASPPIMKVESFSDGYANIVITFTSPPKTPQGTPLTMDSFYVLAKRSRDANMSKATPTITKLTHGDFEKSSFMSSLWSKNEERVFPSTYTFDLKWKGEWEYKDQLIIGLVDKHCIDSLPPYGICDTLVFLDLNIAPRFVSAVVKGVYGYEGINGPVDENLGGWDGFRKKARYIWKRWIKAPIGLYKPENEIVLEVSFTGAVSSTRSDLLLETSSFEGALLKKTSSDDGSFRSKTSSKVDRKTTSVWVLYSKYFLFWAFPKWFSDPFVVFKPVMVGSKNFHLVNMGETECGIPDGIKVNITYVEKIPDPNSAKQNETREKIYLRAKHKLIQSMSFYNIINILFKSTTRDFWLKALDFVIGNSDDDTSGDVDQHESTEEYQDDSKELVNYRIHVSIPYRQSFEQGDILFLNIVPDTLFGVDEGRIKVDCKPTTIDVHKELQHSKVEAPYKQRMEEHYGSFKLKKKHSSSLDGGVFSLGVLMKALSFGSCFFFVLFVVFVLNKLIKPNQWHDLLTLNEKIIPKMIGVLWMCIVLVVWNRTWNLFGIFYEKIIELVAAEIGFRSDL